MGLPRDFNRRCLNHRRASVSAQPSSHLQCLVDPQGASPSPLLNVEHNRNGKNGNLHRQPSSLLQWLVDSKGASPSPLKVERKYQGKVKGWGMVADEDIAAHDIILSVPLTATITSQVRENIEPFNLGPILQIGNNTVFLVGAQHHSFSLHTSDRGMGVEG